MTKIEGHRKDSLRHLKLESIIVGDRFRSDFGDLDELVSSIREKGIIQPVSVDSNFNLLAGGRRMAAATIIGLPTVPAIIRDFVDEIDSREIELMENVHRKDFSWAEQAKLVKRIDELYKSKHGSNWSGRKTAELLDKGVATVARNLQLAEAMESLPELAEFKTADEALKVLKKIEDNAIVTELRARQQSRLEAEGRADPAAVISQLDSGIRTILNLAQKNYIVADVFKGMEGLRTNGNIQLIECDPPYGIDLHTQKGSSGKVDSNARSYEEVPKDEYPGFLNRLAEELYRVAGKDCWLVFWYGPTWHHEVLTTLRAAGWMVDDIPALWTKPNGQTLQPEMYFARGYEPFFLARKGKPVMVERGRLNVFNFPGVAGKTKFHPTQRPLPLIEEIFNCLAAGNTHVFVPFLGSGATLLTCYALGFSGFGFDLNGEYKDRFMLEAEKQARKLFDVETDDED